MCFLQLSWNSRFYIVILFQHKTVNINLCSSSFSDSFSDNENIWDQINIDSATWPPVKYFVYFWIENWFVNKRKRNWISVFYFCFVFVGFLGVFLWGLGFEGYFIGQRAIIRLLVIPVESLMLLRSTWQNSKSQSVVINPKPTEHHRADVTENGKDELGINQEQVSRRNWVWIPLSWH